MDTNYQNSFVGMNQEKANNYAQSIFVDSDEELLALLGNNAITKFFSTGILGNGFALLSNKRLYFKGTCFLRQGKAFIKKMEERMVDLSDITGSGFVHNKNMVAAVLFNIFYLCSWALVYPIPFHIIYLKTNKKWALYTALFFGLFPLLFYFLYKALNYSLFEISYAGGGIAFDVSWITKSEAEAFQKSIQKAKDNLKASTAPIVNEHYKPESDFSKIKELKDLLDSGAISQEEYDTKKKQLLGL